MAYISNQIPADALPESIEVRRDEENDRYGNAVARSGELLMNTTRAIWQSGSELLRAESERLASLVAPAMLTEDPAAAVSAWREQWRDSVAEVLEYALGVNGLLRECGIGFYNLYEAGLQRAVAMSDPFRARKCG